MRQIVMPNRRNAIAWIRWMSRTVFCGGLMIAWTVANLAVMGEERSGANLYQQHCARCHGDAGQGVEDEYADALAGDKSVAELSEVIVETMPLDDPGTLAKVDADIIAAYIYDTFYSPGARTRNQPARIEYSRLTVTQYKNAVADLFSTFRRPNPVFESRGMSGTYVSRRSDARVNNVVCETVDFDFGKDSPFPEKLPADAFDASYRGAMFAPDSGTYEIHVDASNATRVWLNDPDLPLINEGSVPDDNTGWTASIQLLGGRWYLLRVALTREPLDKKTSIHLRWKPPSGVLEVIPNRFLSQQDAAPVMIVETPFPADDRTEGYERGTRVSPEWAAATTQAAIETAEKAVRQLDQFLDGSADSQKDKAREFCLKLVERAFRRPLSESEQQLFVDRHFTDSSDVQEAVKRVVILALKSPRFLCRESPGDGWDDYELASWLSFSLWDSLPDAPLLDAAARGELKTAQQIQAQVERMLQDPRSRAKLRSFMHEWLQLERAADIAKDSDLYPGYSAAILADLRVSLDLAIEDALWSAEHKPDFRRLFNDETVYMNDRLAKFYGVELPEGTNFQRVPWNRENQAGLLTHPLVMLAFAHEQTTSPILRGVFIARNVLGRSLKPPQNAIAMEPLHLHPELTTRERVRRQTSAQACLACHDLINNLGFALENFDAVGRYRHEERNQPIDATGSYVTRKGERVAFAGPRELGAFVANSRDAQDAFLAQLFRYLTKQSIYAFGDERLGVLHEKFSGDEFDIRSAILQAMVTSGEGLRAMPPPLDATAMNSQPE